MTFASHVRTSAAFCLAALALGACGRPAGTAPQAAAYSDQTAAPNAVYLTPPELSLAVRQADGAVHLTGSAAPSARVRLASPEGTIYAATAGPGGAWSIDLPPASAPRMFAVSAETGSETVRAEGALLVLPPPGPPGLLARAGFAAVALGSAPKAAGIAAIDYDSEGGAAVAGFAQPGVQVRLSLDGQPAGLDLANAKGRFAVMAPNRRLSTGRRQIKIEAQGSPPATVEAQISPPAPLTAPYRAVRQAGAWRVDWKPPGGGVQTTLVFDTDGAPGQ
ncbi:MAG: hypothetical protein ABIO39_00045 [Caulobacteraceae bacterium]